MLLSENNSSLLVRAAALPFVASGAPETGRLNETNAQPLYVASTHLYREYTSALNQGAAPSTISCGRPSPAITCACAPAPLPSASLPGCGVVQWNEHIQIDTPRATYHTRLDNLVLHQLAQQLLRIPVIQAQLRYVPNHSLYPQHDELRYVEYTLTNHQRNYKLKCRGGFGEFDERYTT